MGWLGKSGCKKEWLVKNENLREKLYTMLIYNVDDPLEPGPLWESRHGGGKKIVESETGESGLRLRDALDAHRGEVLVSEGGGKMLAEKVFNDVVVYVSADVWGRERQMGGRKLEFLADSLSGFHRDDFRDCLVVPERKPSYAVLPDPDLKGDEVRFQFGFGVFVPNESDRQVCRILLKMQDKTSWAHLPDLVCYENGKPVSRPVALYADQQFLLIGPRIESAVARPPATSAGQSVWFSSGQGYIFLNMGNSEDDFAFGDGERIGDGEKVEERLAEAKSQILFREISPAASGSGPGSGPGELLMLKIEPVSDRSDRPDGKAEQIAEQVPEPERRSERGSYTIVPGIGVIDAPTRGRTIIPGMIGHQLVLAGFGLIKADRLAAQGLDHWKIWFDDDGRPMSGPYKKTSNAPAFASMTESGLLYCREPGEKEFKKIPSLPFSAKDKAGRTYEVAASPLPEMYCGFLMLPEPRFFPLGKRKRLVGYGVPDDQIKIETLASPQSLVWESGRGFPNSGLGHIYFSGEHAEVELAENKLAAKLTKGQSGIYHLDSDLNPVASQTSLFETGRLEIAQGEYLLAGPYLLCFG